MFSLFGPLRRRSVLREAQHRSLPPRGRWICRRQRRKELSVAKIWDSLQFEILFTALSLTRLRRELPPRRSLFCAKRNGSFAPIPPPQAVPLPLHKGGVVCAKRNVCRRQFRCFCRYRRHVSRATPHPPQAVPLCLAAARSPLGSNSPPDCYSIPRGRFATHWGRHFYHAHEVRISRSQSEHITAALPLISRSRSEHITLARQAYHGLP